MEDHYQGVMRELNAKSDAIAALVAQRSDQAMTIQMAEAHLHDKETELIAESQQRYLAMSLAREVHTGTAEVVQRYEREVEQTAQTSRMSNALADADHKIDNLEGMLRESVMKDGGLEFAQLLSRPVSAVYALKWENIRL